MIVAQRTGRAVRLAVVGALVAGVVVAAAPAGQAVDVPLYPGSLPDTGSAVTASGRGPAADLAVHVNQTKNLTTQGISLSWSWPGHNSLKGYGQDGGGLGTVSGSGNANIYLGNYVQVMQCWGDAVTQADVDRATGDAKAVAQANFVAANPGPAREQCQYGGTDQRRDALPFLASRIQDSRSAGAAAATSGTLNYGDETAYPAQPGTFRNSPEIPFRSVDGVETRTSFTQKPGSGFVWNNNYFGTNTTNEINVGPVSKGTGGANFQTLNSADAPGLGCGALVSGSSTLTPCWLVVVPRIPDKQVGGTAKVRNDDTAQAGTPNGRTTLSSPLASTLWANRIAIPLDFRPTRDACSGGGTTYQTVGSALPQNALLSWQAALCSGGNTTAQYNYTYTPDSVARQDLASGSSSLRLLSNPVSTDQAFAPTVYAPLTVSGISVSFVFEPAIPTSNDPFSAPQVHVNLNQRLVAKALTQSYFLANPWRTNPNADGVPAPAAYSWLEGNPNTIWQDPEFWALNPDIVKAYPEMKDGSGYTVNTGANGYLQVNGLGSDGYTAVWKWLLSDPDTRDFLAGKKDTWGMGVNPVYSTDPKVNPGGTAFDPAAIDYFPSLDPWQGDPYGAVKQCDHPQPNNPTVGSVDLAPYAQSLQAVARNIVRSDTLNKAVVYNCADADNRPVTFPDSPVGWLSQYGAPTPGQRKMLGLTDTASSAQYGITAAYLRNAAGEYVAPTTGSMQAAASHLSYTGGVEGVGQPDPSADDPAAYPLSLVTYGAVQTDELDAAGCAAYATLLDYAATKGQEAGADRGQLPFGYAPLTDTLKKQTADAAKTVAACTKSPQDQTVEDAGSGTDTPGDVTPAGADADLSAPDAPADAAVGDAAAAAAGSPQVSLAANRGTTKPDPSVFAWVVPIALLVALLAVLAAPVAGVRRRRAGQSPPGGD